MESSITRPIATVNAPNVKIFKVISIWCKKNIAINNDNGIDTIDITVVLKFLKNSKITMTAKTIPNIAFSTIKLTEASIGSAWSKVVVAVNPKRGKK